MWSLRAGGFHDVQNNHAFVKNVPNNTNDRTYVFQHNFYGLISNILNSPPYLFWLKRTYKLSAKNMEYFSFQRFFVFCGVCRVYLFLIYIPTSRITLGELIHTQ